MNELTHLDLFSGIGGFALAAKWNGYRTLAFCDNEPYAQAILKKHWPDVPCHKDIREVRGDLYAGVTLLTGGFPCQPFSVAGKQRGKGDDRYLWPEMLRVIREARPAWIIGENVAGIVNMALDQVHTDLEAEGYEVESLIIPACAVDAPHRRDRVWIVGNSKLDGPTSSETCRGLLDQSKESGRKVEKWEPAGTSGASEDVADSNSWRLERAGSEGRNSGDVERSGCIAGKENVANTMCNGVQGLREQMGDIGEIMEGRQNPEIHGFSWFERDPADCESLSKSFLGRVAHGIPNRSHRLKGLGNAIVPQVAAEIIRNINLVMENK